MSYNSLYLYLYKYESYIHTTHTELWS